MKRSAVRADPRSVRHWNEFVVVDSLSRNGQQRISELGSTTGLTPAPLGHVLRSLESKGWVTAGEPIPQGRGRPAQVFALRKPPGSVIGLDVGAHAVRALRLRMTGEVAGRAEVRAPGGASQDDRLRAVRDVLSRCLPSGEQDDVWVTMLAVGGHLAPDGTVVRSVAIPQWDGQRPVDLFGGVLPSRATLVNDVRAATWAEHAVGGARGYDEVLVAQLGRRPTLGMLTGGELRHGAHGTAGDMSLNTLLPAEEHMAWLDPFASSENPLGDAVGAALAGDRATLDGARRYVDSIAPALAFATSLLDPGVFVIAGALSPLAEHFLEPLTAHLTEHVQQPPAVVTSPLDQFSSALGAALLALDTITTTLASPTDGVAPFSLEEFAGRPLAPRG